MFVPPRLAAAGSTRMTCLKFGSPFGQAETACTTSTSTTSNDDGAHGLGEKQMVVVWDAGQEKSGGEKTTASLSPARVCSSSTPRAPAKHCKLGTVTFCVRGRDLQQLAGSDSEDHEEASEESVGRRRRLSSCMRPGRVLTGYSIRAACIVDYADGHCLLVPLELPDPTTPKRTRSGEASRHFLSPSEDSGCDNADIRSHHADVIASQQSRHTLQGSDDSPMTLTQWLSFVRRESSRKGPLPRNWQYAPRAACKPSPIPLFVVFSSLAMPLFPYNPSVRGLCAENQRGREPTRH
jgi:hypothetical protein